MGSYDTGECHISPRRSTPPRSAPAPASTPRVPEPANMEERAAEAVESYVPSAAYDPELKTIVALGGGLTPDRIVQPVPDEVRDGSLTDAVKYLMGEDVATRSEDRAVAEAVQARMSAADYRVIVNNTLNLGNDKMSRPLTSYLQQKAQQGEDGELKFNFADIAIVSHDEGGLRYQRQVPLERMVRD